MYKMEINKNYEWFSVIVAFGLPYKFKLHKEVKYNRPYLLVSGNLHCDVN